LIEDDEPTITTGPKEELAKLDSDYALTQRNIRDFILLTVEALKLGQPVDLSQVRGVSVVAAVEAQAAALRSQL
jgi:ABC-type glucose/galactose transport system permease subunit